VRRAVRSRTRNNKPQTESPTETDRHGRVARKAGLMVHWSCTHKDALIGANSGHYAISVPSMPSSKPSLLLASSLLLSSCHTPLSLPCPSILPVLHIIQPPPPLPPYSSSFLNTILLFSHQSFKNHFPLYSISIPSHCIHQTEKVAQCLHNLLHHYTCMLIHPIQV